MFRLFSVAVIALALSGTAAADSNRAVASHKLVVVVKKNLPLAAEKKLSLLVLVSQNGGPPSAAVATAAKPLVVFLSNHGLYRVKAELNTSCKGTCTGSYRISGAANHKLEVIPSCRLRGSSFVCSRIDVVKVY